MAQDSGKQAVRDHKKKKQNERQRLEKALEEGLEETFPRFRCGCGHGARTHAAR